MAQNLAAALARARLLTISAVPRVVGFGLAVLVQASVSVAAIPAMIEASGEAAWGAIALGQAIGLVAGVAVGYGWGWFGPARIAQYGALERRVEYLESILARSVLLIPISVAAAVVAYGLAPYAPLFAATAAVCSTSLGLSASWYFVGLSKPFALMLMDTMPRALVTGLAILAMYSGVSAIIGPISTLIGSAVVLASSSFWIFRETGEVRMSGRLRSPKIVLAENRHGILSALISSIFNAAPLAIVSVAAPGIQPVFALTDKIKTLVVIGAMPAVSVLQGWVPRTTRSAQLRRTKVALVGGLIFAATAGVGAILATHSLVALFGNGQISVSKGVTALLATCISALLFQAVLERVALATVDYLRAVTRGLALGLVIGWPLIWLGARQGGVAGALGGVIASLLVVIAIELFAYKRGVLDFRRIYQPPANEVV